MTETPGNYGKPSPSRLDRLETILADLGDVVLAQSDAIAQLGEQTTRTASAIEALTANTQQLAEEAAQDR